ncbi:IMPACT family protein [Mycoplasma hafezii]|uniref:IMPACT family protein n=1 Tax=Mycoplasma hafezii TaxID=525886 RepID=UPI003CF5B411
MIKTELIIKKSRFISYAFELTDKANLKEIISSVQKENKKARHVCYGYLIYQNGVESGGFNDDGEPKNTAGRPIYDLLQLKKMYNYVIVVARYFGGIKLGAGGLIRAYRESALLAINQISKGVENENFK